MNIVKHFRTITKHRHTVIYHGFKTGILFQSLFHDLSKYSLTEFLPGAKYFVGIKSPNEIERQENGYSLAWMHHKGRNKHHFEYWVDYNPEKKIPLPVKMPLKYVKEMFCDRVSASKIYQGDNYTNSQPVEYFMRGKPRRSIHPETSDLIELWLTTLADKGEEYTFNLIKSTKEY